MRNTGYDYEQTDGFGNTTRTTYDNFGRVTSTIDALGYATTYGYDALGRQTSVTDPLTNAVTTAYYAEGHIVSQRGATYPVDYTYDEFGDKVSMTTYRNELLADGDTTRWLYDEPSGCMTNKLYSDGKGLANLREYHLGRSPRAGARPARPSLIRSATATTL